jgi:type 1 glutamine amidotransferase
LLKHQDTTGKQSISHSAMSDPHFLVITKGHPFEKGPFFEMLDRLDGQYTHVEQPLAASILGPELMRPYDCLVFYDMPGINFESGGPIYPEPSQGFKTQFLALLKAGKGMVFLHHAIAGWPSWPEYRRIIGGQFLYTARKIDAIEVQDSGYRHNVRHEISVVDPTHPVTDGLPPHFEMTDELYLYEVDEPNITPLLTSNYAFQQEHFYSAAAVVERGLMHCNDGWTHPSGSSLVGWTKQYDNSRICYLQGGDDAEAWQNEHYQQLLNNAIAWASNTAGASSPKDRSRKHAAL